MAALRREVRLLRAENAFLRQQARPLQDPARMLHHLGTEQEHGILKASEVCFNHLQQAASGLAFQPPEQAAPDRGSACRAATPLACLGIPRSAQRCLGCCARLGSCLRGRGRPPAAARTPKLRRRCGGCRPAWTRAWAPGAPEAA